MTSAPGIAHVFWKVEDTKEVRDRLLGDFNDRLETHITLWNSWWSEFFDNINNLQGTISKEKLFMFSWKTMQVDYFEIKPPLTSTCCKSRVNLSHTLFALTAGLHVDVEQVMCVSLPEVSRRQTRGSWWDQTETMRLFSAAQHLMWFSCSCFHVSTHSLHLIME